MPALVMNLMEPFLDAERNLTTDNWFTSQKRALKLRDSRTTLVGTLRNNSNFLPALAKSVEGRQRGDAAEVQEGVRVGAALEAQAATRRF